MPEHVPLREHMEQLFELNKAHVDGQFAEVKAELAKNRFHTHPNHPTWSQMVTVTIASLAVLVPVLVIFV